VSKGPEDAAWNGEWRHAVKADKEGFRAEIAVPWATLAQAGLDITAPRINLQASTDSNLYGTKSLRYLGRFDRKRCELFVPLRKDSNQGQEKRSFKVTLHFAECDDAQPGERVFDVKLQGQTVLRDFDIARESGGKDRALTKSFTGISVADDLIVELAPKASKRMARSVPIISGLQIRDENHVPLKVAGDGETETRTVNH